MYAVKRSWLEGVQVIHYRLTYGRKAKLQESSRERELERGPN